jgi:hypothetical protein
MAVLNAQYKHPSSAYSQGLKDLIDSMLKISPKDRPDIHQVIVIFYISSSASNDTFISGHRDDRSGATDVGVKRYTHSDAMFIPLFIHGRLFVATFIPS